MLIALEGVTADEFGEAVGLMRGRAEDRAHFVESDRDAALGELESGFGAGETAADNMDTHQYPIIAAHGVLKRRSRTKWRISTGHNARPWKVSPAR